MSNYLVPEITAALQPLSNAHRRLILEMVEALSGVQSSEATPSNSESAGQKRLEGIAAGPIGGSTLLTYSAWPSYPDIARAIAAFGSNWAEVKAVGNGYRVTKVADPK